MKILDMNQVQEVNGGWVFLVPVGAKVAKASYAAVKAVSTVNKARKVYKAVKKAEPVIDAVATGAIGGSSAAVAEAILGD